MPSKKDIIDAIRRTAEENEGRPLGLGRFERETGITSYEWGKYWARFGDAQKEAGYVPNKMQGAYADEFLIEKIVVLVRKLHKFPTYREIQVESNSDLKFPDKKVFRRFGNKEGFVDRVVEYCKDKDGYEDIINLCGPINEKSSLNKITDTPINVGEVYLFKSGRYYKIGMTCDTVRRGKELRIQLPEKCVLIHSIKTDDPSGIETYWHKRFEAKRKQGEWFDLNSEDVKVFKRWRRII